MNLDWLYDNPFIETFTVCDQHIDDLGHTNNTVYSQWCEETAWKHSASLGLDASDYQRLDRAMAIQHAAYHYQLPSFKGETLLIGTWLTGLERKLTMERSFQIFNQSSGALIFQGQWQLVCIKLSSNKPSKIPLEFIDTYSSHIVKPLSSKD